MSSKRRLRVVETQTPLEPQAAAAQFTRELVTPPGPPWRQRKVAELDARLGAPVSHNALAYRITRSQPWAIGVHGRFTVVYTRGGPPGAKGTAQDLLSGATGLAALKRTRILLAIGVTMVSLTLFGVAISSALNQRAEVAADLSTLDAGLGPLQHRAAQIERLDRQAGELDRVGGADRSVARVLADLDWLAAHKRTDVAVGAVHWLHGVSAIETTSQDNPFLGPDRRVQRASRPVRPGVWLWGAVGAQGGER